MRSKTEGRSKVSVEEVGGGEEHGQRRPAGRDLGVRPPKPPLGTITDIEIQARTGFSSKFAAIAYIIVIVCNGDVDVAVETSSQLTWFEEWMLFLQWEWGRQAINLRALAAGFKTNTTQLRRILARKLSFVLAARTRWPMFSSLEEQFHLSDPSWRENYGDKRLIMWDDTNIPAASPSDPEINKHFYSQYYGGCVAKAGVGLQTTGWQCGTDPHAGNICDSDYMIKGKLSPDSDLSILEEMEKFVEKCPVHSNVPFSNIMDKGYRIVLEAHRCGGQICIQPNFAQSDRRFNSNEVLRSAAIATDRSSNERAVKVSKRSGLVARGQHPGHSTSTIADAWLCWTFQVNFMYKPVLKVNY